MSGMGKSIDDSHRSVVSRALAWLTPVWIVASIVAIAWQVSKHWGEIISQPLRLDLLSISLIATLGAKFFSALQVRRSLRQSGAEVPEKASFYAYSMADLAKYLPGGIWGFVGRIALYRKLRLDRACITRSLIIEQVWLIGGSIAIGCLLLAVTDVAWQFRAAAIAPAIAWIVALVVTRRFATAATGSSVKLIELLFLQAGLWGLAAVGFGVLLPYDVLKSGAAFSLAFAAGLMVPFAPSGIGVRELVVGTLLTPSIPLGDVVRALILSRAVWIVADLLFALVVLLSCQKSWAEQVEVTTPR